MTPGKPPFPTSDLKSWARDLYTYLAAMAPIAGQINPTPILLPHVVANVMARATTDGILLYDPTIGAVIVSKDGEFVPITMDTAEQYGYSTTKKALTATTAAQAAFNWSANGALTLPVGRYEFEAMLLVTGMSATSGNLSFTLAGPAASATLAAIMFSTNGRDTVTPLTASAISGVTTVTATTGRVSIAAAATGLSLAVFGQFSVSAAGTIVPAVLLETASAASVLAGSYFKCRRLGGAAPSGKWS